MFHKTGDPITTPKPLPPEEVQQVVGKNSPEIGQVSPDDPNLVWDGLHWVPRAEWEARTVEE